MSVYVLYQSYIRGFSEIARKDFWEGLTIFMSLRSREATISRSIDFNKIRWVTKKRAWWIAGQEWEAEQYTPPATPLAFSSPT